MLKALPLAYFHVFPYAERQGTAAARRPDMVPAPLRKRRAAVLRALSGEKRAAFQQRFIGETLAVLFERPKYPGVACGYTRNYIRVEVATAKAASLRHRILPVRLLEPGPDRVSGVWAGE